MTPISNTATGIIILTMWCLVGAIVMFAPGSFRLQRSSGSPLFWVYNIFHLLFEFAYPGGGYSAPP